MAYYREYGPPPKVVRFNNAKQFQKSLLKAFPTKTITVDNVEHEVMDKFYIYWQGSSTLRDVKYYTSALGWVDLIEDFKFTLTDGAGKVEIDNLEIFSNGTFSVTSSKAFSQAQTATIDAVDYDFYSSFSCTDTGTVVLDGTQITTTALEVIVEFNHSRDLDGYKVGSHLSPYHATYNPMPWRERRYLYDVLGVNMDNWDSQITGDLDSLWFEFNTSYLPSDILGLVPLNIYEYYAGNYNQTKELTVTATVQLKSTKTVCSSYDQDTDECLTWQQVEVADPLAVALEEIKDTLTNIDVSYSTIMQKINIILDHDNDVSIWRYTTNDNSILHLSFEGQSEDSRYDLANIITFLLMNQDDGFVTGKLQTSEIEYNLDNLPDDLTQYDPDEHYVSGSLKYSVTINSVPDSDHAVYTKIINDAVGAFNSETPLLDGTSELMTGSYYYRVLQEMPKFLNIADLDEITVYDPETETRYFTVEGIKSLRPHTFYNSFMNEPVSVTELKKNPDKYADTVFIINHKIKKKKRSFWKKLVSFIILAIIIVVSAVASGGSATKLATNLAIAALGMQALSAALALSGDEDFAEQLAKTGSFLNTLSFAVGGLSSAITSQGIKKLLMQQISALVIKEVGKDNPILGAVLSGIGSFYGSTGGFKSVGMSDIVSSLNSSFNLYASMEAHEYNRQIAALQMTESEEQLLEQAEADERDRLEVSNSYVNHEYIRGYQYNYEWACPMDMIDKFHDNRRNWWRYQFRKLYN